MSNRNQRRRRGIFVEPKPKTKQAPSGAAYSEFNAKTQRRKDAMEHRKISLRHRGIALKKDVAPTELDLLATSNYKDASPTGFETGKKWGVLISERGIYAASTFKVIRR